MALAVLQIEADFVINSNLLLVFDLACFELIFIDDLFADGARKTIGWYFKMQKDAMETVDVTTIRDLRSNYILL